MRRHVLPAAGPVDLHRVVGGRIVAGGDHDAAVALLVTHGKGKLGRAAVAVEEIDREAGGHHDLAAQARRTAANGAACRRRWRTTARRCALAVPGRPVASRSRPSPWALSPMVRSLMALQPIGYIRPRRPPVPKGIVVQKASSSSAHFSAARCSATWGAYSRKIGLGQPGRGCFRRPRATASRRRPPRPVGPMRR